MSCFVIVFVLYVARGTVCSFLRITLLAILLIIFVEYDMTSKYDNINFSNIYGKIIAQHLLSAFY